jgi:hypothetical protein
MTLAQKVLMIEPEHFDVNPEIATDNIFLKNISADQSEIRTQAKKEFAALRSKLAQAGIEVIALNPVYSSLAPDAVFPNNWFSTHSGGTLVLYPMMSPLRRNERHSEIITLLKSQYQNTIDLTKNENTGRFLEGTGSIVIAHRKKIAFASESLRTHAELFSEWCTLLNYEPVLFHATDENGKAIYHTNVILTVGENFAIICSESIRDEKERAMVINKLNDCGLALLQITFEQVKHFSGNALALRNRNGNQVLIISEQGWNAMNAVQKDFLKTQCAEIITSPLATIEACGGGSARCMLGELF